MKSAIKSLKKGKATADGIEAKLLKRLQNEGLEVVAKALNSTKVLTGHWKVKSNYNISMKES